MYTYELAGFYYYYYYYYYYYKSMVGMKESEP